MTAAARNRFARHRLLTLLLLCLLTAIGLDCAAAGLLLDRHIRRPHGFYHHGFVPMAANVEKWGGTETLYYTNSLAMRDASRRDVSLESERHRILLLGDSFAEGVGVEYEQSVAGRLAAARPDAEILNAAVVSHSPRLAYLRLIHLADTVGLDFDEVVVFVDISDVQDEYLYQRFEPQEIAPDAWRAYRVRSFLRQWSYVGSVYLSPRPDGRTAHFDEGVFPELQETYRPTRRKRFWERRAEWPGLESPRPRWVDRGRLLLLESLGRIVDYCEQAAMPLTLVVYPWPTQLGPEWMEGIHVDEIREFAAERGVRLVDLYPVFADAGSPGRVRKLYFFPGDIHWNRAGHDLVARVLSAPSDRGPGPGLARPAP